MKKSFLVLAALLMVVIVLASCSEKPPAVKHSSPAQLAKSFHVTRGAMTNTLSKLEWAGYVHVRPDWDDARRKMVAISPAGRQARDAAISAITPLISEVVGELGEDKVRATLPVLRELRTKLEQGGQG